MTKLEQAARQALEALVDHGTAYLHHEVHYSEAITALREALEQPDEIDWIETNKALAKEIIELQKQAEQRSDSERMEPVAIDWEPLQNFWRNNSSVDWEKLESAVKCAVATPVRTKYPCHPWQDLTDDEIKKVWNKKREIFSFARAVIQEFRRKNGIV